MTEPWIPFDATDEEVEQLHVLLDGVPAHMKAPLTDWLIRVYTMPRGPGEVEVVNQQLVAGAQILARVDLGFSFDDGYAYTVEHLRARISGKNPRAKLQLVDYALRTGISEQSVTRVDQILRLCMSTWMVVERSDGHKGLGARVPEGVQDAVKKTIEESGDAGRQLAKAWSDLYKLSPEPSEAMAWAVKAVETASIAVVVPTMQHATLGNVIREIRSNQNWKLTLRVKDAAKLDHRQLLLYMLEALWQGHEDRHGAATPAEVTFEQAQTSVHGAATLVAWFSAGLVVK